MDEQEREHVRDDLKGIIRGDLLFDQMSCALYSTDASIFQVEPLGVVAPRDEEDVQALVRYAAEHQLPLIPRGAGSGLAGESLGRGLVVDLSRHLRSVLEVTSNTVRVQPGVVLRELNAVLARAGRRFAPDPSSAAQCTLGGMLATNASGARVLRHGYTRDHVSDLRVVLDSGDVFGVGIEPRQPTEDGAARLRDVVQATIALIEENADLIKRTQPRTPYNRCGYLLNDVLGRDGLHLARLLVGSEGTLGLFTEATLKTIPLPVSRSLVLLGFANQETALRAAMRTVPTGPSACELIDHRLLTLVGEQDAELASVIPAGTQALLLVEYESEEGPGAGRAAADLVDLLQRGEGLPARSLIATEPLAVDRLWNLRETALPNLYSLRGGTHPLPFIEDVGVPLEALPDFLRRVQDILQKYEATASYLIHAGTGQVHTRPFLDLQHHEDVAKLWAIAEEVHSLAIELKGTISTQHGTGLARTPWVARQHGRLYPVLRELKAIFDPHDLFNPGKIIGPSPELPAWPLRGRVKVGLVCRDDIDSKTTSRSSIISRSRGGALQLQWRPGEVQAEIVNCNGCGQCRTEAPGQRMCPIFRATHDESATPRAKANLLRNLFAEAVTLSEAGKPIVLNADQVRAVADLCVNCKMCAHECPARVNIPKLMLEAKAANVAEHGLNRADWVLAHTESFAAFGSAFAPFVNFVLGSGVARWFLEKMFHVSRRRKLPTFTARSFLKLAHRHGLTKLPTSGRPRVVYFVDVFANYNDPSIAAATVAVLQHNGFDVYVPPGQIGCGMAPLAQGDAEAAREAARVNLRILADLAREGDTIVCSEPTAALMLNKDYLDLVDTPDAQVVADRVIELTTFLWDLHQQGKLKTDFGRLEVSIGHHVPCHVKALGPAAGPRVLSLVPGLRVHPIDVGCSGMAGTYGLRAENYETSRAAGAAMLEELARPRIQHGSSECSTCRMQMEDGSDKRALHPVQYLAMAYGL
ncbi:MAG: FAD-linked oxidase C-terminal domain-containing protein, partial [Gemmataceae bacterium]